MTVLEKFRLIMRRCREAGLIARGGYGYRLRGPTPRFSNDKRLSRRPFRKGRPWGVWANKREFMRRAVFNPEYQSFTLNDARQYEFTGNAVLGSLIFTGTDIRVTFYHRKAYTFPGAIVITIDTPDSEIDRLADRLRVLASREGYLISLAEGMIP